MRLADSDSVLMLAYSKQKNVTYPEKKAFIYI